MATQYSGAHFKGNWVEDTESEIFKSELFKTNFFEDWKKVMTEDEKEIIQDLNKCDFSEIKNYLKQVDKEKSKCPGEQKAVNRVKNEELVQKYEYCTIDGRREKIKRHRIMHPGIFQGRGRSGWARNDEPAKGYFLDQKSKNCIKAV